MTPVNGSSEARATQRRYDRQARIYDLTELPQEVLVFGRLRRRLWGEVDGGIALEVGVGTGKNLPYHPDSARVVAVDISPGMLRRAVRSARKLGRRVDLLLGDAQHLPFRDGVFDVAVASFVFCSVPDPVAGLREVRRAVRPEGRVYLLEHVRASGRIAGRLMDLANPIAVRLSGANINRDTVANVAAAGVNLDAVESRGLGILKLIRGSIAGQSSGESGTGKEAVRNVASG